jgi:phage-related protein
LPAVRTFSVQLLSNCVRSGFSGFLSSLDGFASSLLGSLSSFAHSLSSFASSLGHGVSGLLSSSSGFLSDVSSRLFLLRASSKRQGSNESGKDHFGVHGDFTPV